MKLLSRVQLFATPWTVAYQAPPSMGFSRQEYWSGLPLLLQGIFPTQGSNLGLQHCKQVLYHLSHQGSCDSNLRFGVFVQAHWLLEELISTIRGHTHPYHVIPVGSLQLGYLLLGQSGLSWIIFRLINSITKSTNWLVT